MLSISSVQVEANRYLIPDNSVGEKSDQKLAMEHPVYLPSNRPTSLPLIWWTHSEDRGS